MKIGVFGDPHITKKIHEFENEWETSVLNTFKEMYETFANSDIEFAICTGDFFDKAVLEAKHVKLINDVISTMSVKTYLLLGNHEIDSNEHNILSAYEGLINNFIPITKLSDINNILFIPYNTDLNSLNKDLFNNRIIVTHHDIYGSVLAGGKVKASFGYDPNMFNDAKIVFNGHIHLRSVLGKVINVGSLFSTQFGELNEEYSDFPMYYIYDTETGILDNYINKNSLYYVTCNIKDLDAVIKETYSDMNVILRISYEEGSNVENIKVPENVMKVSMKKLITNEKLETTEIVKNSVHIDIKEMISSYINNDNTLSDSDKSRIKERCLSVIGG